MDTIHIDGTINEGESPYEYKSHMLLIVFSHTMYLNGDVVSISNSILGNQLTIIGRKQIDISGIVMNLYWSSLGTVSSNSQDCIISPMSNYNVFIIWFLYNTLVHLLFAWYWECILFEAILSHHVWCLL